MHKTPRPTIFDLVKHTGISRGTISRAFNDQKGISPITKQKILEAAKKIGYIPHNGARMMKLGMTKRWGFLIPHLNNPYYAELTDALNTETQKNGITLLVGISNNDKKRVSDIILQWTAGETDGLILDQSHYHDNPALFENLKSRGIAMLFLHGDPIPGFDFVRHELYDSMVRVMNHYKSLGHSRIAYAAQNFQACRQTERFKAYSSHATATNQAPDESLIYFGDDSAECGMKAFQKWKSLEAPPTAVVCGDDIIACGVIYAARLAQWSIPTDLSVVGLDDISESARIGLTTVKTNRVEAAKQIFELLNQRIADFTKIPEVRSIQSEFILRDSVGRPNTNR